MQRPRYINESTVQEMRENGSEARCFRGTSLSVEPSRCCAYNETRERFLSADVEAADFSAAELDPRLATLQPGSDKSLWMVPFRGISATIVRRPIDLVYLDRDRVVLAAVESFPLSRVSPTSKPAATVLALPAHSIAAAGMFAGDQLILCSPDEMTQRLRQLTDERPTDSAEDNGSDAEEVTRKAAGNVLLWINHTISDCENPLSDVTLAQLCQSPKPVPAPNFVEPAVEPAQKVVKSSRNWLQRLFSPDPPEPRKAPRQALSELVAYFFTGGAPAAHGIRDISQTGLYVITNQRWYLGTIVRMTLTDLRQPTRERWITVHATVVRWGNDGVGLQFVLNEKKDPRRADHPTYEDLSGSANKAELREFILRFRQSPN